MYLFSNAIKNIFRNKGRYLLVGGIITIILIAVIVSAMINATTKEIISDYVDRFSARVYFTQDQNILMYLIGIGAGDFGKPPRADGSGY